MFKEYKQNVRRINKINLSSNYESISKNADSENEDVSNEFLVGGICPIAASEHSLDTVCFLKIIGEFEPTADATDDYGHKVIPGQKNMLGHFLEKVNDNITSKKSKVRPLAFESSFSIIS